MAVKEFMLSLQVWIGAVGGIVGTALGLYNFFRARKKEDELARTEGADWNRWVEFLSSQQNNPAQIVFMPETGSDEHKWAERMVAKNMLRRLSRGMGYSVMGSQQDDF